MQTLPHDGVLAGRLARYVQTVRLDDAHSLPLVRLAAGHAVPAGASGELDSDGSASFGDPTAHDASCHTHTATGTTHKVIPTSWQSPGHINVASDTGRPTAGCANWPAAFRPVIGVAGGAYRSSMRVG